MKSDKPKKRGFFRTVFMIVIPSLIIVVLLIYMVFFSLSVSTKVSEWKSAYGDGKEIPARSPEEWELVRDKAFLTARIALAANDSIGMTINLQDSLVQLETKGVILKQIHFDEAEVSRFFKALDPSSFVASFSKPFKITGLGGTIVKEPITVKKAPKDSIEAAQNVEKIDTSNVEFVEWHLELNNAFVISLVQSDRALGNIDWPALKYRLHRYYNTLVRNTRDIIHLRKPAYYPEITIYIPRNEAKSFYRGLSVKGGVVLRF